MSKRKRSVILSVLSLLIVSLCSAQVRKGAFLGSSGPSDSRKKPCHKLQSFNGMRISPTQDPFQVVLIESTKNMVAVTFNIPINPASFTQENILINDEPLSKSNKIRFNKNGKHFEIMTELSVGTRFTLEFTDIQSYDGKKLAVTKFYSLLPWTSTEYLPIKAETP